MVMMVVVIMTAMIIDGDDFVFLVVIISVFSG
jgi:hypothetical protein